LAELLKDKSAFFRRRVSKSLNRLQQAIRYRESMRLERTRLFGMYRALYLALGEKLAARGILAATEAIFYLTEDEIAEAVAQSGKKNFAHLATERKLEFEGYKAINVPSRVTVPSPPVSEPEPQPETPGMLRGTGCLGGVVTGEVVVITGPDSDLDVTGKIVCALRTDPGWAALFPVCRGVLIQKGSALSHSVILLRELGLPTIINIPGLTQTLQTGQRVMMNGSTGEIKILMHETSPAHSI
jgi:pyruvate,water dikinase